MVKLLIVCLIFSISFALPMPDLNMQEMLKVFSEMEDDNTIFIGDSNYTEILQSSSYPWFLFFADVRIQKSVLSNPVWVIFSEEVKEKNWRLNLGKIDIPTQEYLREYFRISKAPTFIYIDDGYYYVYDGSTEVEDFTRLIQEKTYLQYDRQLFITDTKDSYYKIAKKLYKENPAAVIGGLFVFALCLLHLPNICIKASKQKKE